MIQLNKVILGDFELSTSPELRAREAILKDAVMEPSPTTSNDLRGRYWGHHAFQPRFNALILNAPDLMETVDSNSAAVVWKLASPEKPMRTGPGTRPLYSWDDLRKSIEAKSLRLDCAFAAISAGPIRFNLSRRASRSYRFSHLDQVKGLMELFDERLVLVLHDGNRAAAWTNLFAATRLVTAREPEPPEACHLARLESTEAAFEATWQALQTNGWSDAQLAALQAEWESVDFFIRLPDTAAFKRASDAAACQRLRLLPNPEVPFGDFMAWAIRFPVIVWTGLNEEWRREQYLQHDSYFDETELLLHDRDREIELRRAVKAQTWSGMRRIHGRLRPLQFTSQYQRLGILPETENRLLLGRAAIAETQRRILIAALALERHRARHGAYPHALSALAPELLKNAPVDFMDGQPLRYSLSEDGHFTIYSVGLDCTDNGGLLPPHKRPFIVPYDFGELSRSAIVWPLPASVANVEAARLEKSKASERR